MQIKQPEAPVFVDFEGDRLTVYSASPLPPGSRVAFLIEVDTDAPISVQGKVVHADTVGEGRDLYRLSLRVHSLTREERRRLTGAEGCRHG